MTNDLVCGLRKGTAIEFEIVNIMLSAFFKVTLKKRSASDHFVDDASQGPHIHFFSVDIAVFWAFNIILS